MIRDNRLTPAEYAQNFSDIHPPFETRDAALVDANRCLFCYDAPCTKSCPTGIDVPKFIKQITTDNLRGSRTYDLWMQISWVAAVRGFVPWRNCVKGPVCIT